jgi:hypothetical protein
MLDRVHDQFGRFVDAEGVHDVGAMHGDRIDAQ